MWKRHHADVLSSPHRVAITDPVFPLSEREAIQISNLAVHRQLLSPEGRSARRFARLWFVSLPVVIVVLLMQGVPTGYAVLSGIATFVTLGTVFRRVGRDSYCRHFRTELRSRGQEICVSCGSWLGNFGDSVKNCPECGADREPMGQ
jgi:hypothetical protein